MKRLLLVTCLWSFTALHAAQEEQNDEFTIELGRTGKKVTVNVNLEQDTVEKLYGAIEEGINHLNQEEKKRLGLLKFSTEKEEKLIKSCMHAIKKGLFPLDRDGRSGKKVRGNTPLKKVPLQRNWKWFFFIPYFRKVTFQDSNKGIQYKIAVTVREPCIEVNNILLEVWCRLKKHLWKDYFEGFLDEKVGFSISMNSAVLEKIKDPTGLKKNRVIIKDLHGIPHQPPIDITLNRYYFQVVIQSSKDRIWVEGLHCTSSLRELDSYIKEKGFEVEKININDQLVDLHMEADKRLYEVGFRSNYGYYALEKGGFYFLIDCPSINDSSNSLAFELNKTSSVGELYDKIEDFLKFHKNDDSASFAGPILVGGREIMKTDNRTVEGIGIQKGDHIIAFEKWKIKFEMDDDYIKTVEVEDPKATFTSLQSKGKIGNNYVIFDDTIISPQAPLATILTYDNSTPIFPLADPKRVSYLKYKDDDGSSCCFVYSWKANEVTNIASYTEGLEYTMAGLSGGLLFTKKGQSKTIAHALNRVGSDPVDVMLYDPENNKYPIEVTPYLFNVRWKDKEVSKSKKITELHPYETLEDLVKIIMGIKVHELAAVVIGDNKKYRQEDFSKTTLVELGVDVNTTITLRLEHDGRVWWYSENSGLENLDNGLDVNENTASGGVSNVLVSDHDDVESDDLENVDDHVSDGGNSFSGSSDILSSDDDEVKDDQKSHGGNIDDVLRRNGSGILPSHLIPESVAVILSGDDDDLKDDKKRNGENIDNDLGSHDNLSLNGQNEGNQKSWYTEYFYWIVGGGGIAVILIVIAGFLLMKDRIVGILSSKKDGDQ